MIIISSVAIPLHIKCIVLVHGCLFLGGTTTSLLEVHFPLLSTVEELSHIYSWTLTTYTPFILKGACAFVITDNFVVLGKWSSKLDLSQSIQVSWSTPLQVKKLYTLNKVEFLDLMLQKHVFEHVCGFFEQNSHMCNLFHYKLRRYAHYLPL